MKISVARFVLIAFAAVLFATPAAANIVSGDFLGTFSGNDSESALLDDLGFEVMLIAKVDLPLFSNDDLSITDVVVKEGNEPISGEWNYAGSDLVDIIVVKAGNGYTAYQYTDANTANMRNVGSWSTASRYNKGLSHLTAYKIVPEPMSAALLIFGTTALAIIRKRR